MTSKSYYGWKYSKAMLARHLGITPAAMCKWGEPPQYAIAYINLYNDHQALKRKVRDFAQSV